MIEIGPALLLVACASVGAGLALAAMNRGLRLLDNSLARRQAAAPAAKEDTMTKPEKTKPARQARYQVYQDVAGQYRWRLRAANNEIVSEGEAYASERGARRGIEAHRRAAQTEVVERV